jgi:hypothetical protein
MNNSIFLLGIHNISSNEIVNPNIAIVSYIILGIVLGVLTICCLCAFCKIINQAN